MVKLLQCFKALADETRLRLVHVLAAHELNVNELTDLFEMGQSRISRHLRVLTEAGLASPRRDGIRVFYSIVVDGEKAALAAMITQLYGDDPVIIDDVKRAGEMVESRARATQEFFDHIADDWDRMRREVLGDLDLSRLVSERMDSIKSSADLGCGSGGMLKTLLKKSAQVIGVDSSSKMLDLARGRFQTNGTDVSLRIGQLEHLPLADQEVDFALACLTLHHLSQPTAGLAEAHRVLSSGGRLMVIDFDKHNNERMRRNYGDHWLGFTEEELVNWFREAGFERIKVETFPGAGGLHLKLLTAVKA